MKNLLCLNTVFVITFSVFILFSSGLCYVRKHIGIIVKIDGSIEKIIHMSNDKIVDVKNNINVYSTDKFIINDDLTKVYISVIGLKDLVIVDKLNNNDMSSFIDKTADNKLINEFLSMIGYSKSNSNKRSVGFNIRNDNKDVFLNYFNNEINKINSSQNVLYVSWIGGVPPYKIMLKNSIDNSILFSKENINDNKLEIYIDKKSIPYNIEISCQNIASISSFQFIDSSFIPKTPLELTDLTMDDDTKKLIIIMWHLKNDPAEFKLNWITELYNLSKYFEPARFVLSNY